MFKALHIAKWDNTRVHPKSCTGNSSAVATRTAKTSNLQQTKMSSFCEEVKIPKTAQEAMQTHACIMLL